MNAVTISGINTISYAGAMPAVTSALKKMVDRYTLIRTDERKVASRCAVKQLSLIH